MNLKSHFCHLKKTHVQPQKISQEYKTQFIYFCILSCASSLDLRPTLLKLTKSCTCTQCMYAMFSRMFVCTCFHMSDFVSFSMARRWSSSIRSQGTLHIYYTYQYDYEYYFYYLLEWLLLLLLLLWEIAYDFIVVTNFVNYYSITFLLILFYCCGLA